MNTKHVYLDHAATTPLDEEVMASMLPYFNSIYGNPSSVHYFGQKAEDARETSREKIAAILNCHPSEIIFTSCGTESDNLALRGTAMAARKLRNANHLLITPVEHHAVSHTASQLAALFGYEVETLAVDEYGQVILEDLENKIRKDTFLVSVIYANNEIGSVSNLSVIGEICRGKGVPLHSDAVQAGAHLPLDVQSLNLDLMSLGAHKFYGPKGIGVLYLRNGVDLYPAQTGGAQEGGLRAGTSNIPYIVGMAKALEIAQARLDTEYHQKIIAQRDRIIGTVLEEIPDAKLTGDPIKRMPNHASFVFKNLESNNLLILLDQAGFACSSASACKTGNPAPSDVLKALEIEPDWIRGSLRVTLGKDTENEDINRFLSILPDIVQKARLVE
ncbi:MAG: cysteine desulfurase [Anaerolineales bacterium]|nr:cysteine desulfurase [Anaerolineales bacterium]